MQRRAKGEGSYVQRKDGRWQYTATVGKDAAGKPIRRFLYAKTRAALARKVTDQRAEGRGTLTPRAQGTVGQWVEAWLDRDVKPNLSGNAYATYEISWRVHAKHVIADVRMNDLKAEHVEHLYEALREKGVGSSSIHAVARVMTRAINVAIRRGRYTRANPFQLVDKPTHRPKEARALSREEALAFLRAAESDRYYALWVVLLTCGLRLGEALALEWDDIDLARRTLSVRQSLEDIGGHARIKPTKNQGSVRNVDLGAIAVAALHHRRGVANAEGHGSRYVFTNPVGGFLLRSNLRRRHLAPICERAGIAGLTIHGLRHSMTTLALQAGASVKVVADRLGHSTTRMTQDRYSHVLAGFQREAADRIDALLHPPDGGEES